MYDSPAETVRVAVALGANLGDTRTTLERAVRALGSLPGTRVEAVAGWRRTEPFGGPPGQPLYDNGAVSLSTRLTPRALLLHGQRVEAEHGRDRSREAERHGPRRLDVDIILFGDEIVEGAGPPWLRIPHPEFRRRAFVLEPLAEIAGDWVDPVTRLTVKELLARLQSRPAQGAGDRL